MEPMSSGEAKGLLRSLFDFSFTSLITIKIIRLVYMLIVVFYTLGAIGLFIAGLASGKAFGVFAALILVPIAYLVYLILSRITMEILIVVFRIGDDVRAIRVGRRPAPHPLIRPSALPAPGGRTAQSSAVSMGTSTAGVPSALRTRVAL